MKQNQEVIKEFYKQIDKTGYKARIIQAKHIKDLKSDIKNLKVHMYPNFYEEYKSFFEFTPEVDFENIKSLVVIAVPVPQYKIIFRHKSKQVQLLIPPTYLFGQQIVDDLEELLNTIFNAEGFHINYARLPVKTLAVRSGLAKYGKNNITYVPGLGSFYRLAPFYTDLPIEDDVWLERETMDLCEKCNACLNACPTGAISPDRFLLKVDRCLTYHNEQPGHIAFPDWIDSSWHNCLVGCLHCQIACPANKKVKNWIEQSITFEEDEVDILLQEKEFNNLPKHIQDKLKEVDLENYTEVFSRNLGVFLD